MGYYSEVYPGDKVKIDLSDGSTVAGKLLSLSGGGVQAMLRSKVTVFYPYHAVKCVYKPTKPVKKVKKPKPYFD